MRPFPLSETIEASIIHALCFCPIPIISRVFGLCEGSITILSAFHAYAKNEEYHFTNSPPNLVPPFAQPVPVCGSVKRFPMPTLHTGSSVIAVISIRLRLFRPNVQPQTQHIRCLRL